MNFKNKTKIIENEEVLISIVKVQEILVYSIKNYWIDLSIESAEKLIYTYLINNKKNIEKDVFIFNSLLKEIKNLELDSNIFYNQFGLILNLFFSNYSQVEFDYNFFIEKFIDLFKEKKDESYFFDIFLSEINTTFNSFYSFTKDILFYELNIKSIKLEIIYEKKEKVLVKLNIDQKVEFFNFINKIEEFYEENDYKSVALNIESIYSDYILKNLSISSKKDLLESLKGKFPESFFLISILENIDKIITIAMSFRNSLKSLKNKINIGNKEEEQIDIFNNLSADEKKKIMRFWIDSVKTIFNFLMID